MSEPERRTEAPWPRLTVPERATKEWAALQVALDRHGPPPCDGAPEFTSEVAADHQVAAKVCRSCRVRQPCADYADVSRSVGTWGGITRDESYYRKEAMSKPKQIKTAYIDPTEVAGDPVKRLKAVRAAIAASYDQMPVTDHNGFPVDSPPTISNYDDDGPAAA